MTEELETTPAGLDVTYAARSVRGRRDRLQDNYFCMREVIRRAEAVTAWAEVGGTDPSGGADRTEAVPELVDFSVAPDLAGVRLYALSDGVGGHNRGDLAAAEAVRMLPLFYQPELRAELDAEILRHGLAAKGPLGDLDELDAEERVRALLRATYQLVNTRLHFHEVPDIRTTLVTLALEGPRLYLANIGDSRVYRFAREPGAGLRPPERLTVDDSYLDRRIYEGEDLPFAPCSYDVAPELRGHLEQEGRYSLEFIFDLTRLESRQNGESFDHLCKLAHDEIQRILADGSARAYRRAMQLGTIAPAYQIKDEGLLRALGHQEWLAEAEIGSTVRQGRRRPVHRAAEPRWLELGEGDLLLLCSDGLTDSLPESSIHELLAARLGSQPAAGADELAAVCAELVAAAERQEQCLDNVSAVLVQTAVSPEGLRRSDTGRLSRAAIQRRAEAPADGSPRGLPPVRPTEPSPARPTLRTGARPGTAAELPVLEAPAESLPTSAVPSSAVQDAAPAWRPEPARPATAEPEPSALAERAATRLAAAVAEKRTLDREVLAALERIEQRLVEHEEKLEQVRLAAAELRGRLGGMLRRAELLDRLAIVPTLCMAILIVLLALAVARFVG